ncbi:2OG-Fe(II) oxygenase [Streptomyces sp. NPDC086010]|uniref:2OG-Fe(II) oxygenase n=1 Tax=Streptomyces sp. NPDC086010 TaxID=3365745 RepID=UPI0037D37637
MQQAEIDTGVLSPSTDHWSPTIVVQTPFLRLENFLGTRRADALLGYALTRQSDFVPGTVMDPLTGQLSSKGRRSQVLPVHSAVFSQHLADSLPLAQDLLGVRAELTRSTSTLTAHGDDGYFGIHTDATKVEDPAQALSAIYYLHKRPRGFQGGQLRLYDTAVRDGRAQRAETYRTIEPDHDTLVIFPSSAYHEVLASTCPSGQFADHRFTLTTWIS